MTVSVPPQTTEPEIEALLVRFQVVGHGDREGFGRLKIKPTTPADPAGRYQRVTIYVFDNQGLAEEPSLRDYLAGADPLAKAGFERGLRATYRLAADKEFGAVREKVLFQGKTGG